MIENIASSKQFVYHYTRANIALDYILKNRTLQFGNYNGTNDPKESKSWEFDLGTNEERDLGKYNMTELSEWLSLELKSKTKLSCFSMDAEGLAGNHIQEIFKRGFCKPRMWAQYSDNHSGVCLVFHLEKLKKLIGNEFHEGNLIISGPVKYTNRIIIRDLNNPDDQQYTINVDHLEKVGREAYVEAHLRTHCQRLFFEKMTDWRDESEWRYVVFTQTEDNLYLDFQDSLAGIMFGANTSEKNIQSIMDLTESWGIRYMGLKWKNCSPWYDYGNLRYIGIKNSTWG
jgi:hypothetical protein